MKINGADPDFHRRDLWDAIQSGNFPEWELGVQLFDEDFADSFAFDVLDATKLIPEEEVPRPAIVGRLVLDRWSDNFFAETEQVAFCTQNIVPGIDFTNDPLLQGRNFSYLDTQLKRLGRPELHPSADQRAQVPVRHLPAGRAHGDDQPQGPRQLRAQLLGTEDGGPREDPAGVPELPQHEESGAKRGLRPESFADHYSQARQFYISQTEIEQEHIADALTFELSKCESPEIRTRMVAGLRNVDEGLARAVADGLGLARLPKAATTACPTDLELAPSAALSIVRNGPESLAGRKVGPSVDPRPSRRDPRRSSCRLRMRRTSRSKSWRPPWLGWRRRVGSTVVADQKIDGGSLGSLRRRLHRRPPTKESST